MSVPMKWLVAILFGLLVFAATRAVITEQARRAKEIEAEEESIHVLAQATSKAELIEAVGELGIFLTLKDSSWIAIRSRCVRSLPLWASSVALDSEGNWSRSNCYLSGIFRNYRVEKERIKEFTADELEERLRDCHPYVHAIAISPDLEAAYQALDVLGFSPFHPETKPVFQEK
jgi:hypothetical protein